MKLPTLNLNISSSLVLFICLMAASLAAETIQPASPPATTVPFEQMPKWLHFDREELAQLRRDSGGTLDFSSRFVYEGDYSMRWQYKPGESLLWRCVIGPRGTFSDAAKVDMAYNGDTMESAPTFYFTALEPKQPGHPPASFRIEFLDAAGTVAGRCDMLLARKYWNRCFVRLSNDRGDVRVGFTNLVGCIPADVSAVRITPLADKPGEVFLGGWFLTQQWTTTRANVAELNGFPTFEQPDTSKLPEPTPGELAATEAISRKLAKGFMADWRPALLKSGKPQWEKEELQKIIKDHYEELNLRRTPEGMTGWNVIMSRIRSKRWCDFDVPAKYKLYEGKVFPIYPLYPYGELNQEYGYCQLMLDIANCYRREQEPGRKAEWLERYEMMFDYSQYISGFPSTWFQGEGYIESVFLMRDELIASKRLTPELLGMFCLQNGFERIFRDHSVYCTVHPGDLGEDCDFTRITSERFIFLSLMASDSRVRVHHLHAFQRWFSRIVLAYSPGIMDTFKPDGSVNHHRGLQFGYGAGAFNTVARVVHLLARTPFAIEPQAHAFAKKALLRRSRFADHAQDPVLLSGKNGLGFGNMPISPFLLMALAGSPDGKDPFDHDMAAAYLRLVAETGDTSHPLNAGGVKLFEQANIQPEPTPSGHFTLGWSAANVHRRGNWLLLTRGYSRYAYAHEATAPLLPYMGFGAMELLTQTNSLSPKRYYNSDFLAGGYDWTRYAGTTSVFLPFEKLVYEGTRYSDQGFVGGVDAPDGNGIFVLSLHGPKETGLESFHAKKSWFYFGDTIVCLGSGIRDDIADSETGTTLFQDLWRQPDKDGKAITPLYWNGAESLNTFPLDKQEQLNAPFWAINRQDTGYYVYPGQQLVLRRSKQMKNTKVYGVGYNDGNYTTAWLSHGNAPKDASYRYLMRVGVSPETMAAFAEEMNREAQYRILRQDGDAHIVTSKPDTSTGYVIFKGGTSLNNGPITSASKPCVVMAHHKADGSLALSVADPDLNLIDKDKINTSWGYSQPSTLTMTLAGKWEIASGSDATVRREGDRTLIDIVYKDGLTCNLTLTGK